MMDRWVLAFTEPIRDRRATAIFCKAMYVFVLLKIMLSWPTFTGLAEVYRLGSPRSVLAWMVFGPGEWAVHHITVFLSGYVLILLLALWLRPNYFTAAIIAWLWLNLYRFSFPVSNGADQVALTLLVLVIPLSAYPASIRPLGETLQRFAYHTALLFARIYVCTIYVLSGIDKLASEAWRSGEAMVRVRELTYMFNPSFDAWIPKGDTGLQFVAWITIVFELLFPILIWFKTTRPWMLIAGVVFHIIIGVMLSLPEFAAVMIVSYAVFLKPESDLI